MITFILLFFNKNILKQLVIFYKMENQNQYNLPITDQQESAQKFKEFCMKGDLETCKKLYDIFLSDKNCDFFYDCFYSAISGGHINIGQWLHDKFDIILKNDDLENCLYFACVYEDLEQARWLYFTFGKCENMYELLYPAYKYNNDISKKVVCFLFRECGLDQNDIKKCSKRGSGSKFFSPEEEKHLIQIYNECFPIGSMTKPVKIK